jgi:hypothetical protein
MAKQFKVIASFLGGGVEWPAPVYADAAEPAAMKAVLDSLLPVGLNGREPIFWNPIFFWGSVPC